MTTQMQSVGLARPNGVSLVLMAAVLWGTTGTAQAFGPPSTDPLAVGTLRLLVGGGALSIWAFARGVLRRGWPLRPTLIGVVAVAAYQLCFFTAVDVDRTGVAVGTVVAIGSAPVFAGLLSALFLGERPTRTWLIATALAIVGCTLLVTAGGGVSVDVSGVILALGAGLSYAIFALSSKTLLGRHPPDAVMAVIFSGGALLLLPLLLTVDTAWVASPRGVSVVLWLGLMATAMAYALYARGLQTVPVSTVVTLSLGEPLTAGLLGVVVLREPLTPSAAVGVGLLFAGLALLAQPKRKVDA